MLSKHISISLVKFGFEFLLQVLSLQNSKKNDEEESMISALFTCFLALSFNRMLSPLNFEMEFLASDSSACSKTRMRTSTMESRTANLQLPSGRICSSSSFRQLFLPGFELLSEFAGFV